MSVIDGPSDFTVTTTVDGTNAVVTLHGKAENLAAFELGESLDAIIDLNLESVVLDLAALVSIGAAGLVAVANAEKRLEEAGVALTVRSPSALVARVLDIMEAAETARLEAASPSRHHLGPEQLGISPAPDRAVASKVKIEDLRRLTAVPADPDVVDGALRLLIELARSCVSGADGVSVSLLRHGVLSTVAASDETIMEMDADQYATGEGPCVDASLKGHWFHTESLDGESRWPSFTPRARSLGIQAILSSPLKAFEEPVGALNIYSRTALAFDVKAQETAAVFARKASVILSDARAGVTDTQMALRFQEGLRSREFIAMAKGVLMEREGIDEEQAFSALLRLSLYHGETLRERAETMLRSSRQPEFGLPSGSDV
jgi:anti-anti-sigma factor